MKLKLSHLWNLGILLVELWNLGYPNGKTRVIQLMKPRLSCWKKVWPKDQNSDWVFNSIDDKNIDKHRFDVL